MADQRARIWIGATAPSSPETKPFVADACLWYDTTTDTLKWLYQTIPVDLWQTVNATALTHATTHVTGGSDVIANAVAAGNAGLMTGADKTKLDGIASGAEVNVNADWNSGTGDSQILNKPSSFTPASHGNEAHSSTFITASGVTYENLDANADVGTSAGQLAIGNHTHAQLHDRQHSITAAADHTFPGGTSDFLRSDGVFASPGAASTNIKQTEVDFGVTPVSEASFTVTDADVGATSQLLVQVAYEAPTGKDLDEIEMDDLQIRCGPGAGQFTMYIRAADGSYLADKFKINYLVG